MYLALYGPQDLVIFDHPYNADRNVYCLSSHSAKARRSACYELAAPACLAVPEVRAGSRDGIGRPGRAAVTAGCREVVSACRGCLAGCLPLPCPGPGA